MTMAYAEHTAIASSEEAQSGLRPVSPTPPTHSIGPPLGPAGVTEGPRPPSTSLPPTPCLKRQP